MKGLIEKCKVFIFDLDGTLYEGTSHFDYYANEIKKELPSEKQELFEKDYLSMNEGRHTLQIGKVYDLEKDTIITLDPMTLEIAQVHTWEGELLPANVVNEWYEGTITYNEERMIAVGDGWWLPFVTGAHYGVKDTYHCYHQTKEYMGSEAFMLPKIRGLKEDLDRLKETKTLILLTNSDCDDAKRLLKELELENIFDFEITDAYKPYSTEQHFKKIMILYSVEPDEVVSIGDNFINDIAPALKLGMHAVHLSSQGHSCESESLVVLHTLREVFRPEYGPFSV